jgi:hypothetical protein
VDSLGLWNKVCPVPPSSVHIADTISKAIYPTYRLTGSRERKQRVVQYTHHLALTRTEASKEERKNEGILEL